MEKDERQTETGETRPGRMNKIKEKQENYRDRLGEVASERLGERDEKAV